MYLYEKIKKISLCLLVQTVYLEAELVIIKQNKQGFFSPLESLDKPYAKAIADIMLTYSWPTVIANSSLASEESAELFSNKAYAEEQFITEKLQKINSNYRALFIPTALYELFAIIYYSGSLENCLKKIEKSFFLGSINLQINLNSIDKKNQQIKEKNYDLYRASNSFFYSDAFFIINNELISALFDFYKPAKKIKNKEVLSAELKNRVPDFAAFLLKNKKSSGIDLKESLLPSSNTLNKSSILARALSLEYEAAEANRTVLFRGSSGIELKIRKHSSNNRNRLELLGSSIKEEGLFNTILERYSSRNYKPYSVSFGNSLFAGYFNDKGACAYEYLYSFGGYALFLDKKDQIEHESSNLFFIAPLGTLAGLFERGEFFHSRTKAAIKRKTNVPQNIFGIAHCPIIDPFGIVTTVRDPLKHASLFSDFLAKNLKLIEKSEYSAQNQSEKIVDQLRNNKEDLIRKSQKEASSYFKLFPTLKKYIQKLTSHRLR